jgi:hypothetical protein
LSSLICNASVRTHNKKKKIIPCEQASTGDAMVVGLMAGRWGSGCKPIKERSGQIAYARLALMAKDQRAHTIAHVSK